MHSETDLVCAASVINPPDLYDARTAHLWSIRLRRGSMNYVCGFLEGLKIHAHADTWYVILSKVANDTYGEVGHEAR